MSDQVASLCYAVRGPLAWLRIQGRANCMVGVDFVALIRELRDKEFKQFSLDLRECLLMDSSFLGALAGMEQEFGTHNLKDRSHVLELVGASPRVSDLIKNLGLDEYFHLIQPQDREFPDQWIPVPPSAARSSRLLCSKMSLEAHEVIVRLNPANEEKFRDVVSFLKEDVKRLESGEGQ